MSPHGRITFEILGPLRAFDGAVQLDLGASKQRAVLALLLLNANKPVTPTALIDGIWADDPPENGANVIQKYVAGLRRVLEPARFPRTSGHVITLTEGGYLLNVDDGGLDLALFHQTVARASDWRSRGQIGAAVELLRGADQMWRGEPLAGLGGPAIDSARHLLIESRGAAKEMWADLEMQLGHHSLMIPTLAEAVAQFPLREGLRYLHILALYRSGRQAEALASYDETRRLLSDDFGIDPSERLRELHRQILQADPRLNPHLGDENAAPLAPPRPPTAAASPPAAVPSLAATPYGADRAPASGTAVPARTVILGITGIAVPLLSCGFATWAVMIFFAVYRRSRLIVLASAAYLATATLVVFDIFSETQPGKAAGLAIVAMLVNVVGGAVHGGLLGFDLPRLRPDASTVAQIVAKARRTAARELVQADPSAAARLGIGRPHAPRQFDDGGLVDVNAVPLEVLIGLGLPAAKAEAILLDRHRAGPLLCAEDLLSRGLLTPTELARLRDFILVPVTAATDTGAVGLGSGGR